MATLKDKLTPKQEAFCKYYAIEKLSQRQAYIAAYGKGNQSDNTLDVKASQLVKRDKIQIRLKELQENLAEKAIWSKIDMINDLREIAIECKETRGLDSIKARGVAVSAIKTAGDMLGYKAAEKLDIGAIEIIIKGGDEKYGK